MEPRTLTRLLGAGALASACLAVTGVAGAQEQAAASHFDGSRTLICATLKTRACIEDRGCIADKATNFDIPTFMIFDFAGKEVRPTEDMGGDHVSPIEVIKTDGGRTIIQGIEEGRAWSANLDQESGHLTVGIVGHGYTISMVGECAVLPGASS